MREQASRCDTRLLVTAVVPRSDPSTHSATWDPAATSCGQQHVPSPAGRNLSWWVLSWKGPVPDTSLVLGRSLQATLPPNEPLPTLGILHQCKADPIPPLPPC